MHVYYATQFVLPLPAGHRFPMEKYRMLRDALAQMPGIVLRQAESAPDLDRVLARCASFRVDDLAQPAPLIDLWQAGHDRLYSRLFNS